MASEVAKAKKEVTKTSTTTRMSKEIKKDGIPKGAEILSSDITTETEEIENGWLITKRYDIRYKVKGSDHTDYAYYNKKWYSKTDPLKIELTDKSLADAFESDQ